MPSLLLDEQAEVTARFERLETAETHPIEAAELLAENELMPDWEAHLCIQKIAAAQHRFAEIDRLAKQMKVEALTDLKAFLGNHDRTSRLQVWRAAKAAPHRKKVTTFEGELSETTVAAKCVVTDPALALKWLKEHAPNAIAEKIVAAKLPAPTPGVDAAGERVWTAPPGMAAASEFDALTVNGRRLDVLLRGESEADGAA